MKYKRICSRYEGIHIILAIGIIVFSTLAFWNQEIFFYGYTVVFSLTALMLINLIVHIYKNSEKNRTSTKVEVTIFCVATLVAVIMAVVSIITDWR